MDTTSNLKDTLKRIDEYIGTQREAITKGEALERLMKNPDFKLVILDGYFEAETKKLFNLLVDPTGASPYTNDQINLKLAGISDFKGYVGTDDYVGTVATEAFNAPSNIDREEDERKRVTAEFSANGEV